MIIPNAAGRENIIAYVSCTRNIGDIRPVPDLPNGEIIESCCIR